ncbi:MAG: 3-deoxy-manno-octulosonate cytidylyltransferase [Prevotellaceae bacterium]|jgi:3-deoxy-manno-octulosonate cytidylyltransferase (CMP-KDO synthetase)|nr:3-deoxy-manno-octulosonate cytidylyltransferase [Prevotellaceae bacterium]
MNFIAIIPARYASTRFPGKPLADVGGKPMVQRVYEQAQRAFAHVFVATDDERIAAAVKNFGGKVIMTSASHRSGTDRCAEAALKAETALGQKFDVVVNVQGDEPFIAPLQLEQLKGCFTDADVQLATLVKTFGKGEDVFSPNSPKVVVDASSHALYFSRSVVPYLRSAAQAQWPESFPFYKHVGLYAYRTDTLQRICRLPQSQLELAEELEQLRWIENGYRIKVAVTELETWAIDTPEDLEKLKEKFL